MGIRARNMTEFVFVTDVIALNSTADTAIGPDLDALRVPFDCRVSAKLILDTATTVSNCACSIQIAGTTTDVTRVPSFAPSPIGTMIDLSEGTVIVPAGTEINFNVSDAATAGTGMLWVVLRRVGAPGEVL